LKLLVFIGVLLLPLTSFASGDPATCQEEAKVAVQEYKRKTEEVWNMLSSVQRFTMQERWNEIELLLSEKRYCEVSEFISYPSSL
jgi:hypothetical protein